MRPSELRREDIFIYAMLSLGANSKFINIEDIYKKSHELLPSAFSWSSYPEIPSDRKSNMALQHIREQKGKNFIENSKNHDKLKLSKDAVDYIESKKLEIESSLKLNPIKASGRSSNSDELKILHNLHNEEYVQNVISEKNSLKEDKILTLLKISSLSPLNIKLKKINKLIELAMNNNSNPGIVNFLEQCKTYYE